MFVDKIRQYGFFTFVKRAFLAGIRPLVSVERFFVFIIPRFEGRERTDDNVFMLSDKSVEALAQRRELSDAETHQMLDFLEEGCRGIGYKIDDQFAGSAWVQYSGDCRFGREGSMSIPSGFAVVKNLLVVPNFRGRGLGKALNEARLALIPAGKTPTVFIIPDNRIAIRNWEMFGFRYVVSVTTMYVFSRKAYKRVNIVDNIAGAKAIADALSANNSSL